MNDWVKKWARRLGGAGLALLLAALAACGAARAQEDAAQTGNEAQIEYQYGPWSEWSLEAVEPAGDIEVQTRQARELTMKTVYAYSRFAYQGEAGMQYAPCEVEGVEGQWQSETVDQPKAVSGEADGIIRYEGDWFNQSEGQAIAQEKAVTQYRYRARSRVLARFEQSDLLMGVGDSVQMTPQLGAGVDAQRLELKTLDQSVAEVDAQGQLSARAAGQTALVALIDGEEAARVDIVVGTRQTGIEEGIYALRLCDTGEYMACAQDEYETGTPLNLVTPEDDGQCPVFWVKNVAEESLRFQAPTARLTYVTIRCDGKEPAAGQGLKLAYKTERKSQFFQVYRLSAGEMIVVVNADKTLALCAVDDGQGGRSVGLARLDLSDRNFYWKLLGKSDEDAQSAVWILPVARNGQSYLSQSYKSGEHNGVDLGSGNRRVDVLAVADGKVIEARSDCTHDYPKKQNSKGKLTDPCGSTRTYGNYITIKHANGLRTTYAHLSEVYVKVGDSVSQGDVIGVTGTTGASTAVHLHFEVRKNGKLANPRNYISLPEAGEPVGEADAETEPNK